MRRGTLYYLAGALAVFSLGPLLAGGVVAFLIWMALAAPFGSMLWLVWRLAVRPVLLSLGKIQPTPADLVIRGWNAERNGHWKEALFAYDGAIQIQRWDDDAETRRVALLQRRPDLAREAEPTERERLAKLDPGEILHYLRRKTTDRKLRLVAVACLNRVSHLLTDERSRTAVEAAEKFADGMLSPIEAQAIWTAAVVAAGERAAAEPDAIFDIHMAAAQAISVWEYPYYVAADVLRLMQPLFGRDDQANLLLCVFGLPHYTSQANPEWLTSTVVALARGVYEDRGFDRLPILADALQDAGCENEDILTHCRGEGPHVRGCWVVDLLLGKE